MVGSEHILSCPICGNPVLIVGLIPLPSLDEPKQITNCSDIQVGDRVRVKNTDGIATVASVNSDFVLVRFTDQPKQAAYPITSLEKVDDDKP